MPQREPLIPTLRPAPRRSVLWLLTILLAGTAMPTIAQRRAPAPRSAPRFGVDPNIAPWWELSLLPRLGPSVASAVVEHRTRAVAEGAPCAYRAAEDLLAVRGIGPRTLLKLAPHLRFDACVFRDGHSQHGRASGRMENPATGLPGIEPGTF